MIFKTIANYVHVIACCFMGVSWVFHGHFSMLFVLESFMGISWVFHGYFMVTLACCLCLKVSWVFHGYFMDISWSL